LKPIHLNLAARPFRNYRPLYAVVVAASLVIAFLMLNNIDTYYRYVRETETTRNEIALIGTQSDQERRRATVAQNQIKAMDLVTLGNQTRFINAQLAERAFSWSELLDRLEDVIPRDVRINSITPSFAETGVVHLTMACESKSGSGMVNTLDRFQRHPSFADAFPASQTNTPTGSSFTLTVDYKPTVARVVAR
jgi:Tfp pilus assembly protein PilN